MTQTSEDWNVQIYVQKDLRAPSDRGFEQSTQVTEDSKQLITDADLRKVQATIVQVISGFSPPEEPAPRKGLGIDEVALELGFQLEAAPGKIWRITLVDAKASASISATVTWRRNRDAPPA